MGGRRGTPRFTAAASTAWTLIPKTKLEVVLADAMVEKAVQAILVAARTGKIGDGKIFLTRVDDAIRIRNEERGEGAL